MANLDVPLGAASGRQPSWLAPAAAIIVAVMVGVALVLTVMGAPDAAPRAAESAAARPRPAVPRAPPAVDTEGSDVEPPLPAWVRSIQADTRGAQVRTRPSVRGSERRGELASGTRFALLERSIGPGCPGRGWYRIGEGAWVCASQVSLSRAAPSASPYPALASDSVVPFQYAFTGTGGTRTYARPDDIAVRDYGEAVGPRWGLAILGRELWRGQPVVRTTRGTWIFARALRFARPSTFAGAHIAIAPSATTIPIAWVRRGGAPTYAQPGDRRRAGSLPARAMVQVGDEVRAGSRTFTRLTDGRFVESRRLVRPVRIAPPDRVVAGERWIDVDLASQTLVAYEGSQPVFATLVSTGRLPGSTPLGLHRIRLKLAHATMDDVDEDDAENSYSMDAVPWVQYFNDDIALHGVYWHDRFGAVKSHGCVNLAPRDARWLYAFTLPQVPDGWDVIRPTEHERGTQVHVH